MPPFGSITSKYLVKALKQAGFEGPYASGKLGKYLISARQFFLSSIPAPYETDLARLRKGNHSRIGLPSERL